MATVIVLSVLAAAVVLAVRTIIRDKKNGRSCGGCSGNCRSCHGCRKEN